MNDDSRAELFVTLGISEKGVRGVYKTSSEGPEVEFVPNLNIGGSYAHLTVKVAEDQREVLAMLGRYFLYNNQLEAGRVLMAMTKQDVPHSDGAMP